MDKALADYFFEEASRVLGFVVTEHSFAAPQLEGDDKINFAFATFMGKHLAIECSLDGREGDTTCTIARVIEGKKATYRDAIEGRDAEGVRVREQLSTLLRRRGLRERLFTKIGEVDLRQRIRSTLADIAQMLRKHGQDVLSDSATALK